MIKLQCINDAYSAGFQYGKQWKENSVFLEGVCVENNNPLRHAYAAVCQKEVYEVYDAQVMEELRGVADGVGISVTLLADFVFGMYAFPMPNRCSCFAMNVNDQILFGRTSDFMCAIKEETLSVHYQLANRIPFIGNTTFPLQIEDGVNAYGLAIGLTFIPPILRQVGFHAGFLVRYVLEHCQDVDDALKTLQSLPIGTSQTLTMVDRFGRMAVVECNPHRIHIHEDKQSVYAVNHFYAQAMKQYNVEGLDDLQSMLRYTTLETALKDPQQFSFSYAKEILQGKHGFLCQYEQASGFDTIWSSMYDVTNKKIYRCEGNPSRDPFQEDKRLTFLY